MRLVNAMMYSVTVVAVLNMMTCNKAGYYNLLSCLNDNNLHNTTLLQLGPVELIRFYSQ